MTDRSLAEGVVSASSDAAGIVIVRIFDAPRELVFKAWTEAERFATWFGEEDSTIPPENISMDARPGGAWHATMIYGPDRMVIPFFGEFLEVQEPERVVMTLDGPGEHEEGHVEIFTVDLEDLGDGRTRMSFSQTGGNLPADEYSRAMRGELVFFDRMAEHLAGAVTGSPKARHDTDR